MRELSAPCLYPCASTDVSRHEHYRSDFDNHAHTNRSLFTGDKQHQWHLKSRLQPCQSTRSDRQLRQRQAIQHPVRRGIHDAQSFRPLAASRTPKPRMAEASNNCFPQCRWRSFHAVGSQSRMTSSKIRASSARTGIPNFANVTDTSQTPCALQIAARNTSMEHQFSILGWSARAFRSFARTSLPLCEAPTYCRLLDRKLHGESPACRLRYVAGSRHFRQGI